MSLSRTMTKARLEILSCARKLFKSAFCVRELDRTGAHIFIYGFVLAAIARITYHSRSMIEQSLISHTTVESSDEAFHWLIEYLRVTTGEAQHFSPSTSSRSSRSWRNDDEDEEDSTKTTAIKWLPAMAMQVIFYQRRPILIRRDAGESNGGRPNQMNSGRSSETLSISTISTNPKILQSLIEKARDMVTVSDHLRTQVYSWKVQDSYWVRVQSRPIRPLSTVIIKKTILEPLLADIRHYLDRETEKWYATRGIPYRRGYLFSGPPGCGKTSLAIGLAAEFNLGIYIANLAAPDLTDDELMELVAEIPKKAILLLEDIDVAFPDRETSTSKESPTGVTRSGLLNALDGVTAGEGRIVLLTTNYFDRLDPALIRPGRVDMRIPFTLAGREEAMQIFRNFFGGWQNVETMADQFASSVICNGGHSIAALQGYLMTKYTDPEAAIRDLEDFVARSAMQLQLETERTDDIDCD